MYSNSRARAATDVARQRTKVGGRDILQEVSSLTGEDGAVDGTLAGTKQGQRSALELSPLDARKRSERTLTTKALFLRMRYHWRSADILRREEKKGGCRKHKKSGPCASRVR